MNQNQLVEVVLLDYETDKMLAAVYLQEMLASDSCDLFWVSDAGQKKCRTMTTGEAGRFCPPTHW